MSGRVFFALVIGLVMTGVARAGTVAVFAAVSLKDALSDVARDYETATGDEVELSFGASGKFATQIREGAPADLFISAAEKQVKELIDAKVADAGSRVVITSNRLVLIVPADAERPIAGFSELADARVKRIAIGQPRTVPAGEYAAQVLRKLNLFDAVRERLIYGTNVRQVLDYVRRGEVDAGVVYATDAMAEPKVKVIATAEASLHDPIIYPAVIIPRHQGNESGARKFLDHLQSEAAQNVLRARGFAPTTRPSAASAP